MGLVSKMCLVSPLQNDKAQKGRLMCVCGRKLTVPAGAGGDEWAFLRACAV